jgi:hypothetical protein
MKTINDYKNILFIDGNNTLLGIHLNTLVGERTPLDEPAYINDLELKIEVISQMSKNGIDAFEDGYKLGSVTKAYYQLMLSKYVQY